MKAKITGFSLEAEIKTTSPGRASEKLGTLTLRSDGLVWLPKGNSSTAWQLGWEQFAQLMETEGGWVPYDQDQELP